MPKHVDACLFDLDGTLLDTLEDLADSMNSVLAARGWPQHPVDAFRVFVGDGVEMLVRRSVPSEIVSDALVAECVAEVRAVYAERWNVKSAAYDGIPELIAGLRARGILLGVLSNKPDAATQEVIAHYFEAGTFDEVAGMRNEIPRKPDPAGATRISELWGIPPERILYLGDTDTDMKTAVGAGMFAVGAAWGFREAEELQAHGADVVCAHPREVLAVIDG